MIILYAFLVGGLICAIGQIMMDVFRLLPIHVTTIFVFLGALFDFNLWYDKLSEFAGAGATIPISSFGHSLLHGALEEAGKVGYIGIFTGIFNETASGIMAAITFAFLVALIFKPRG